MKMEDYNDGYYHLAKDLEDYPDAWCYVVWSKRGPGKTYSGLWKSYYDNIPIIYMKRTIDDVNMICSGNNDYNFDPSPYSPLNRDKGLNVRGVSISKKGIGAFYNTDPDGEPQGDPVSYCLAMNAIKSFKGFDFSQCDWILFDEFIPQLGERTSAGNKEGELLLDLYMTVARDRQKRGKKPLKLILFANAEEIATPVTNTLEITDDMADLTQSGNTHLYLEERGILLHHITNDEIPIKESEKSGIYKAMGHTSWGSKTFDGLFSNNDFSNVQKLSLKGFKPMIHIHYKTFDWFIYLNQDTSMWYCCESFQKCPFSYDLNRENEQKKFFYEWYIDLFECCRNDRFRFLKYTMYDTLIKSFKKLFKI